MPQQELCRVYSLLFRVVCAIALHPADVKIRVIRTGEGATFNIAGDPEDIRNIVAHHNEIGRSFAVLLSGIGLRTGQRYSLSIEELPGHSEPKEQACSKADLQEATITRAFSD